mmetsp:Transcript_125927/g.350852  ORF Transcript_125927/g.350852 Transcript_125927/m.350852 type:complete len:208 (+) Transcript_125927:611-1234(+)
MVAILRRTGAFRRRDALRRQQWALDLRKAQLVGWDVGFAAGPRHRVPHLLRHGQSADLLRAEFPRASYSRSQARLRSSGGGCCGGMRQIGKDHQMGAEHTFCASAHDDCNVTLGVSQRLLHGKRSIASCEVIDASVALSFPKHCFDNRLRVGFHPCSQPACVSWMPRIHDCGRCRGACQHRATSHLSRVCCTEGQASQRTHRNRHNH